MAELTLSGEIVDLAARRTYSGVVTVRDGAIAAIREEPITSSCGYMLPGFIDAHIHIESSMMAPSQFARFAVRHGTVATVSDPHEIANVLGIGGVRLMVADGRRTPFHFHFGVPSCVPATSFETAGAELNADAVAELFRVDGLGYLSEMMNYPGVLHGDPVVMAKIEVAKKFGRPIDGHAPGVRGDDARRYAAAGITTDHECFTLDEALDKIACGMKILIREGSAAKNFAALHPLLSSHPQSCMLCSDDLHPDSLATGHINKLVVRALAHGHDLYDVLTAACVRSIEHYGLPVGRLRVGDPADFIVVDDLTTMAVRKTYLRGEAVFEEGRCQFESAPCASPNKFAAVPLSVDDFRVPDPGGEVRVIHAREGLLTTDELHRRPKSNAGGLVSDVASDLLKIAVVNRYRPVAPAVGFIQGIGLHRGAIAASVAHDSHNIVAVGVSDADLCAAVNRVIEMRGGLAVADGADQLGMRLELAGLMTCDGERAVADYANLDAAARALGSPLTAPFMTLSFMALLVIPQLKLSDRGLFDGRAFAFTSLPV